MCRSYWDSSLNQQRASIGHRLYFQASVKRDLMKWNTKSLPNAVWNVSPKSLQHYKNIKPPVFLPLEYRYVKGDDIWLSPFYQQDCASISVHQYHKQDHREIFEIVEPIFWKYGGRPHWGKMHTLTAPELKKLYPRWDDFMHIRQELDPTNKWINPHLNSLFFG